MARAINLKRLLLLVATGIPAPGLLAQATPDSTLAACVVPPSNDTVRTYLTVTVAPFDAEQKLPDGFLVSVSSEIGLQFKMPPTLPLHYYVPYKQRPRRAPEFGVLGARAMFGLSIQRGHPAVARVYASSMSPELDQAAINAIVAAVSDSGAPLPADMGDDPIDLRIFFETVDTIHSDVLGIAALKGQRQRLSRIAMLQNMEGGPQFPERLRDVVDTGFVEAEFVVDREGVPIPFTFRVTNASERAFARSVLDYLPLLQFQPAMIGGCSVPMHVRMPFRFSLEP